MHELRGRDVRSRQIDAGLPLIVGAVADEQDDHSITGLGRVGHTGDRHFEVGTPNEYEVENSLQAQLPGGAVIAYQYGGGAGFESALLRDPDAVREDVLDEYVSIEAARERYGVVLTGSAEACDLAVDTAATATLRAELADGRAAEVAASPPGAS